MEKHDKLIELFKATKEKSKRVAVFLQDNPDPDAIASAATLRLIAEYHGAETDIFYGGEISHPQNKVLVKVLQIELYPIEKFKGREQEYGLIVFADVTSSGGKNMTGVNIKPDIVFDHHRDKPSGSLKLCDIRQVGATSSILAEYLRSMSLLEKDNEEHSRIATALFWGIKTDTNEWSSEGIGEEDHEALRYLQPFIDVEANNRIKNYPYPDYFYECEVKAEVNKQTIRSGCLVTGLEYLGARQRDAIPYIADHQLRRGEVTTVVVMAIVGDVSLQVSLRSEDDKLDEASFLAMIFGAEYSGARIGVGGANIPLGILSADTKASEEERNNLWQYLFAKYSRKVFELIAEGT